MRNTDFPTWKKKTVLISWKLTALSIGTKLIQNAGKVKDSISSPDICSMSSVCMNSGRQSLVAITSSLITWPGQPKGIPTHLCSAGPVSMVTDQARETARMTPFKHPRGDNYMWMWTTGCFLLVIGNAIEMVNLVMLQTSFWIDKEWYYDSIIFPLLAVTLICIHAGGGGNSDGTNVHIRLT